MAKKKAPTGAPQLQYSNPLVQNYSLPPSGQTSMPAKLPNKQNINMYDRKVQRIANNNPNLTMRQVNNRAQRQLAASSLMRQGAPNDPMAQGARQLMENIGNVGGGASGDFQNLLAQIGSGNGSYTPINIPSLGGGGGGGFSAGNISAPELAAIREINPETLNLDFTALRNSMGADANYAQGNALAALDNRAALAGMPGSSRHGIAQGQAIGEIQRGLQTNLAQKEYDALLSDADRRMAAEQANMQGRIATQGNQAQLGAAAMGANAQLGSAAMGANAQVQSAGLGANAQLGVAGINANADLQRAAMQDATNRINIAGNIADQQGRLALDRNQMLYNALGDSYDRSIGYKALNNQAATDRYGIRQNGLNTRLGMQYGLMDNQQNRAMQYGMFNQNMDYQNNALLAGMLNGQNNTMQNALYYGMPGMNQQVMAQLDPASQYMSMIQYYANALGNPIILNNSQGGSSDWSRGNSYGFGFNHGAGMSLNMGM